MSTGTAQETAAVRALAHTLLERGVPYRYSETDEGAWLEIDGFPDDLDADLLARCRELGTRACFTAE